jgi:DNA-directed RNA polymerase subunit RPC12/RpoP
MKCPNCRSQMFITDETANEKSHVTFYRCSICVSEHVSSQPIFEAASHDSYSYFDSQPESRRYLTA